MLRRRLFDTEDVYTLSSTGGSINAKSNSSTSFYIQKNGVPLKVTGVTVNAIEGWCYGSYDRRSGKITVYASSANCDLDNSRQSLIEVNYKDITLPYILTQNAGYLSDPSDRNFCGIDSSIYSLYPYISDSCSYSEVTGFTNNADWVDASLSYGSVSVRVNSDNTSDSERSGSISLYTPRGDVSCTITQAKASDIYAKAYNGDESGVTYECSNKSEGNYYINLSCHNFPLSSVSVTSSESWLTVEPVPVSDSILDFGHVNLYFGYNGGVDPRESIVTFTINETVITYIVTQNGTGVETLNVRFNDGNDYSWPNFPAAGEIYPIGIEIPGTNAYAGERYLSYTKPDSGTSESTGYYYYEGWPAYGYWNTEITGLANHADKASAEADFDGIGNTNAMYDYVLALPDQTWKTASTINSYGPFAKCAWRYHTKGTKNADWYIPSMGEMLKMKEVSSNIGVTTDLLRVFNYSSSFRVPDCFWSSTRCDLQNAWAYDSHLGVKVTNVDTIDTGISDIFVTKPFLSKNTPYRPYFEVNLNHQWIASSSVAESGYNVYQSSSNHGLTAETSATCYVTVTDSNNVQVKIKNNSDAARDYVIVENSSGSTIASGWRQNDVWINVTLSKGTYKIVYRKSYKSAAAGEDRGYIALPDNYEVYISQS